MAWVVRHPNGEYVHSRHNGHVKTIDEKYVQYAKRYTRKLAKRVALEIGGEPVRIADQNETSE